MSHRNLYFCCMIIFLTACRGREHDPLAFKPPVFPETKQVTVTPLPVDFPLAYVHQMVDMGDYILCRTFIDGKFLFLFKKETGAYVKSFLPYGRGPGEAVGLPRLRLSEDKSTLFVFQTTNGRSDFWSYKVKDIILNNRTLPYNEDWITLYCDEGEKYPGSVVNYFVWDNKRFLARNRLHRFEIQDTLGNTLYLYDKYPEISFEQSSDSLSFHLSYLDVALELKPDRQKFVIASEVGCILEIFNITASGKIEKAIEKRFFQPIFGHNGSFIPEKTIRGIGDCGSISVTDNLIYAIYYGKICYLDDRDFTNIIAVFDWKGNPIRQYKLDWMIYSFFVDAQQNRCYLTGFDKNHEILMGYFDL